MQTIQIVKIRENALVPVRASDGAVGYDVYASRVLDKVTKKVMTDLPTELAQGESILIGIGVVFALPSGFQCAVRPRSGLASKFNIELSNSPGTVDSDFRGEIGCLLRNRGKETFIVKEGMRIAQLVFTSVELPILEEIDSVSDLPTTKRGSGGFGSTGLFGEGLGTGDYNRAIQKWDTYFMKVIVATAALSECVRGVKRTEGGIYERDEKGELVGQIRRFGCVFVRDNHIIASGFNFQHSGAGKCAELGCLREEKGIASGTHLEICRAIHAEQAAILQLARKGGVGAEGATMYANTEPCGVCAKMLTELGLETVVMMAGVYPTNGTDILKRAGINIRYATI